MPSTIFVSILTRSASSTVLGIPQDLPGWLPDTKKQQVLDMLLPAPWLKQDPDFQPQVKLPVGWEPPECAASSLRPPAEPLDARLWEGLQQVPDLEVGWLPAPSTFIAAAVGLLHDVQVQIPFVANGCIACQEGQHVNVLAHCDTPGAARIMSDEMESKSTAQTDLMLVSELDGCCATTCLT